MIGGLKQYPAMNDSGVAWLGQVPEHWDIQRLKKWAANVVDQTDARQPADGGGGKREPELDRLSNILKTFNDQFGGIDWQDADRVRRMIT